MPAAFRADTAVTGITGSPALRGDDSRRATFEAGMQPQAYPTTPPPAPCRRSGRPSRSQTCSSASARPSISAVVVIGRRRDAQPLGALGDGRIVDRLDIDAVLFQQQVAGLLAQLGIADEHRHDVGVARHHRQAGGGQDRLDAGGAVLVPLALPARRLQMPDRGRRGRADRRRQRGGEDEARRIGAHGVDDVGLAAI